ncbi:MAG: Tyrosine--tRNA ligase [Candidatus Methanofastidiosum methylothiophilum]|uniref:Tyrosine--tRNA ligase n=1 Tax=Candidatus Methanofastidiosum methylothiophilum TaxID=1705564 RepID=A0A150J3V5_9EURY|nr:MAG: Tyrosine--tRNA ligase [Candidatus Methanofastidiosum methylthiophilus]NMC75885.1 tyrosine--tRNA ligase [Candidatus Methanofastidiosa archaeon]
MDDRLDLITRNAEEVITEEEMQSLLSNKNEPVCYCGYETSGDVHLGHLVTMSKLKDMEKAGFKVKVLFADWHTWLNRKGDWDWIHEQTSIWEETFKSFGLKTAEYVLGSSFERSLDYIDDVFTLSLDTTINRALRSMQVIARDIEHARVSQVLYPFLQIVDIKYLGVDVAIGGIEQRKIHMLGRELAYKINYPTFTCVHTPLISSLTGPGDKMSSSKPDSMISVRDDENSIKEKINKAYCPVGVKEENPLLQIARLILFPKITGPFQIKRPEKYGGNVEYDSYDSLERAYLTKELHPMDLKKSVIDYLVEIITDIRSL